MKAIDDEGRQIDAEFSIEQWSEGFNVVLESQSGQSRGQPARNTQYSEAMRLILERAKIQRMTLEDVQVVSAKTINLPAEERRIQPDNYALPLTLATANNIEELRFAIGRATGEHRRAGTKGGNRTKRVMLTFRPPEVGRISLEEFGRLIAGKPAIYLDGPTANEGELVESVRRTKRRLQAAAANADVPPPIGQDRPSKSSGEVTRYVRDPNVIAWVLHVAEGRCEACAEPAPFKRPDDDPYLEVHHIRPLAAGGPDITENAIACCPNCHRRLHYGAGREELRKMILHRIARLKDFG